MDIFFGGLFIVFLLICLGAIDAAAKGPGCDWMTDPSFEELRIERMDDDYGMAGSQPAQLTEGAGDGSRES